MRAVMSQGVRAACLVGCVLASMLTPVSATAADASQETAAPTPTSQIDSAPVAIIGDWKGEYSCHGDPASLALRIREDAVAGEMRARWMFGPATLESRFASGEFEARIIPGSTPGTFDLQPIRWIDQPPGYRAVDAQIQLEGETLSGPINLSGCGSLSVRRVAAGPPTQNDPLQSGASAANLTVREALPGKWRGQYQCGPEQYIAQLTLPPITATFEQGRFEYRLTGGGHASGAMDLAITFDAGLTNASAELREVLVFTQGQPRIYPTKWSYDLNTGEIRAELNESLCGAFVARRVETSPPLTVKIQPLEDGQATILAESPERPDVLHLATSNAACAALAGWAGQVPSEASGLVRHGMYLVDFGRYPWMFTSRYFKPFFGVDYNRIASDKNINQYLQRLITRDCRHQNDRKTGLDPLLVKAAFPTSPPKGFGNDTDRLRFAIEDAQASLDAIQRLEAQLQAFDVESDAPAALGAIEAELEKHSRGLGADPVLALVKEKRDRLEQIASGREIELVLSKPDSVDLVALERAHRALANQPQQVRAGYQSQINERLAALLENESTALGDKTIRDLQQLSLNERTRLASFDSYPAAKRYLQKIDEALSAVVTARSEEASRKIAAVADLTALRKVFDDLTVLEKAISEQKMRPIWSAYAKKATALLSAITTAVESRKASTSMKTLPQLDGLHKEEVIGPLLVGARTDLYALPRESTQLYLKLLTDLFVINCPSVVPEGLPRLIQVRTVDPALLNARTRDEIAAVGLQAILSGLQTMADPGTAIDRAQRQDAMMLSARADAQSLLAEFGCPSGDIRRVFNNVKQYFEDPAEGVDIEDQRMEDLCLRVLQRRDGFLIDSNRQYCRCAGPMIETQASTQLKSYVRSDPTSRFFDVHWLDRRLSVNLNRCRQ